MADEMTTTAETETQTETVEQSNAGQANDDTQAGNIFGDTNAQQAEVTYDFAETCKGLGLEMSQEASDAYVAICKECGIGNESANKIAAYGLKLQQEAANGVVREMMEREKGWAEQFKQEVGKDYDATLQKIGIAKEWAERLHPGFTQMAVETGAGNHPVFLQLMARIADLVGEENGSRLNGNSAGGSSTMYDKTDFSKYK